MQNLQKLDRIAINTKSHKLLNIILHENPEVDRILKSSKNEIEALVGIKNWVMDKIKDKPQVLKFYKREVRGIKAFEELEWQDYAAIRILDYIDNAGKEFKDLNLRGDLAISNPVKMLWLATFYGTGGARPEFFEDMLHLFRQFSAKEQSKIPSRKKVEEWMSRYPSGLDPRIEKLREENKERIIKIIVGMINSGEIKSTRYKFDPDSSLEQQTLQVYEWWNDYRFHIKFAVRSPDLLNEMLGHSLDPDTMKILYRASEAGIPFFINPYYLSLLHVRVPYFAVGADLAIRHYIIYTKQLVEEFGHIVAWEKEDKVKPGEPNAAGWILPSDHNIHRRYPDVAILIPDTQGRACGGLCSSCQRMFDFQRGNLNFNMEQLVPNEKWPEKLKKLLEYFENDSQLRDILITGGDGLMNSDAQMKEMLESIYEMAKRKQEKNKRRKEGKKYAEITRVRIGSRLLPYLPQRVGETLAEILRDFKNKASKIGIKQFIIQTHFESPMEITPDVVSALKKINQAGWLVTNQLVLTTAASRRGHTAKLRQDLNKVGVLSYYCFTVKGYMENNYNFAPNARSVQEQVEEKIIGEVPSKFENRIKKLADNTPKIKENISKIQEEANLPFLATDRNVLNLPGVGKSLTYRVIGITRYGRRILEFDHDPTRRHSPILEKMGRITIIESKSISEYLRQMDDIGEIVSEYDDIYGYSLNETGPRMSIFEYPEFDYKVTEEMTNLKI